MLNEHEFSEYMLKQINGRTVTIAVRSRPTQPPTSLHTSTTKLNCKVYHNSDTKAFKILTTVDFVLALAELGVGIFFFRTGFTIFGLDDPVLLLDSPD